MNIAQLRKAIAALPDDAEVFIEGCDGCDGPVGKLVEMESYSGKTPPDDKGFTSWAVYPKVAYLTRADSIYWPQKPDDAT